MCSACGQLRPGSVAVGNDSSVGDISGRNGEWEGRGGWEMVGELCRESCGEGSGDMLSELRGYRLATWKLTESHTTRYDRSWHPQSSTEHYEHYRAL